MWKKWPMWFQQHLCVNVLIYNLYITFYTLFKVNKCLICQFRSVLKCWRFHVVLNLIMSLMLLVELVYRHIVDRVLLSFTYDKGALTIEVDHLIRDIIIYHKYIWRIHQHSIHCLLLNFNNFYLIYSETYPYGWKP